MAQWCLKYETRAGEGVCDAVEKMLPANRECSIEVFEGVWYFCVICFDLFLIYFRFITN